MPLRSLHHYHPHLVIHNIFQSTVLSTSSSSSSSNNNASTPGLPPSPWQQFTLFQISQTVLATTSSNNNNNINNNVLESIIINKNNSILIVGAVPEPVTGKLRMLQVLISYSSSIRGSKTNRIQRQL